MTVRETPLRTWAVPGHHGVGATNLAAYPGRTLLIVGPNGAGKSALSHWLATNGDGPAASVTRVLAHRRLWLESAGSETHASQLERIEDNIAHYDSLPNSRVRLENDRERSSKLLYDLMAKVNGRNARIAELVDDQRDTSAVEESTLTSIGRVFEAANLNIKFRVTDRGTFDAVRPSDTAYPISEMSDGEKGALLLAAQVLLSPRDGILIIDEPERHLHRSISADFVTALTFERSDCAFVLLTHDLDLISRLDPSTTTICIAGSISWDKAQPTGWDLKIEAEATEVPDQVRHAIFGGRNQLLFVEGESSSLDHPMYQTLFPDWTVVPCGGSEEVMRAVAGLRSSGAYHWVDSRGVLDGDARTSEEVDALSEKQILVLPVNEVESLYYLGFVISAIADQQAAAMGKSATDLTEAARSRALTSLDAGSVQHLALENAEKIVRRGALSKLPSRQELVTTERSLTLDMESPYPKEHLDLSEYIAEKDLDAIVRRFSVRDSRLLRAVADALGFRNCKDYESAVRVRLANDAELRAELQASVGPLPPSR